MSDSRAKELVALGDTLFRDKSGFNNLCQEIALCLYPERADFTSKLDYGQDFAAHLTDSQPLIMRRDLCNAFAAMLRPREKQWFRTTTQDDDLDADEDVGRYLEYVTKTMRAWVYDPAAKFIEATKQGDHDYGTFGNAVIEVAEAPDRRHLLFRSRHLRDCAWLENETGDVDHLHRKMTMTARQMKRKFPKADLHESVKRACEQAPGTEFNLRVVVMPADEYDYVDGGKKTGGRKHPFALIYIDADHHIMLREGGLVEFPYVVPRWHMLSGSPYAFSPAVMTALPDARMAQDLSSLIVEAGEKMVNPPLVATEEAVRSVNIEAGSVSYVDREYDERFGAALKALELKGDMSVGFEMRRDLRELLAKAFFVDRLTLPDPTGDMTAYETARRVEEHIRNLLPLFEPIEIQYNVPLLDKAFAVLENMQVFDFGAAPKKLKGSLFGWRFESPLQQAQNRLLTEQFGEIMAMTVRTAEATIAAKNAGIRTPINVGKAWKDGVRGTGAPATWRKSEAEEAEEAEQDAAQQKMAAVMQEIQAGAATVEQGSRAAIALREAVNPPQQLAAAPQRKALPAPARKRAA